MIKFEEYKAVLNEGKAFVQKIDHPTLAIELNILNREFQKLKNARGINRELAQSSCDYYANEVRNSIQLATV